MRQHDHDSEHYDEDERENPRHSQTHGHDGDGVLDKKEATRFAQDAFKESAEKFSKAEIGKTKKFLGLFEMDAGIVDMFDGAYNFGADYASTKLRPQIFRVVETFAPRVGLNGAAAKSAAAIAAIGSTAAIKVGGYFGTLYEGFSSQIKARRELARKLAPVLDDIKGNHSMAALYRVGQGDNEVIYAHRQRLSKIANATNLTNTINLAINSGSSLLFDAKGLHGIWKDRATLNYQDVNRVVSAVPKTKDTEESAHGHDGAHAHEQDGINVFKAGALSLMPQAAARIAATNQHKLRTQLSPYSALEMILELNEQVASNPEARGFEEPKGFQADNHHRKEYPLEEYLMRICIQHQKDMADINPQHSEIREALREDLAAAVKPIAAAIRKGDLNVMSLVRLVGEGKIIKKHGRAIAGHEEITAIIAKEAPKQAAYAQVDPAEYYKDAAFSREQLKDALKSLEGKEKLTFAAMFPDAVLAEVGMSKKEIKQLRDATGKQYDRTLGEAMIGLNGKSDEQLEKKGLAKNEIKTVREAAGRIEEQGMAAVHDLKTSPVHENGVEHLLANVVVHQPKYLGNLLKDGREQFAQHAANDGDFEDKPHAEHSRNHASKAANDHDYGHAARENQRRTGTDDAYAELG